MITSWLATYASRVMHPLFPDMLFHIPGEAPTVYLTFDDGPTETGTERLLELFDRYDARATFFLQGHYSRLFPHYVRALVEAGHTVGNHTYTHPDAWRTPFAKVREELERTGKLLEDLTGEAIRHMRPPYGRFTSEMRKWCVEHGQQMVLWDTLPADYLPSATADQVTRRVLNRVRPGSIVVLHDNPRVLPVCLPAVERILDVLSHKGWRFAALT